MTNDEIQALIVCPKMIISAHPSSGYNLDKHSWRKDIDIQVREGNPKDFTVFIRQNSKFIENFSVGLRYKTKNKKLGELTLVRYNGAHGAEVMDISSDGHFSAPHIHRLTAELIQSGVKEPKIQEITDRYSTFSEALQAFAKDCRIINWWEYFPQQLKLLLSQHEDERK